MVRAKKNAETTVIRKKPRVTAEDITEMQRLRREGDSISEIARKVKFNRQTVKMHLTEQKGDTVAIEAKGKVLAEEYRKARKAGNYATSDKIRAKIESQGIAVKDNPDGSTLLSAPSMTSRTIK